MQAKMRSADRNDYNEQVSQERSAFQTSLKVTEDRKKEMLDRHKAIWNEQVALSKRHKVLHMK